MIVIITSKPRIYFMGGGLWGCVASLPARRWLARLMGDERTVFGYGPTPWDAYAHFQINKELADP